MGFNLRNILNDARQLDQAAVAQVNPLDHGATFDSVRQQQQAAAAAQKPHAPYPDQTLTAAMLRQNLNDLPQDNLDGTFNNLKPNGGSVIQSGGTWEPPLLRGHVTPPGVAYFDPTGATKPIFTNDSYYAVPINPDVVPQPMQPLRKIMLPGGNY